MVSWKLPLSMTGLVFWSKRWTRQTICPQIPMRNAPEPITPMIMRAMYVPSGKPCGKRKTAGYVTALSRLATMSWGAVFSRSVTLMNRTDILQKAGWTGSAMHTTGAEGSAVWQTAPVRSVSIRITAGASGPLCATKSVRMYGRWH